MKIQKCFCLPIQTLNSVRRTVMLRKTFISILITIMVSTFAVAQSGGNFQITQTIIASGGGQNSSAGPFIVSGTTGQSLAPTFISGGQFDLRGGFWAPENFAPTSASVNLGGKVMVGETDGMRRIQVFIQNLSTGVIRNSSVNQFGFYRFEGIEIGPYLVWAESRIFQFSPTSFVLEVSEDRNDINLSGSRIFE